MGGIEQLAETVATDMEQRLPGQRKTQRGKLALLVATMLQVRSAAVTVRRPGASRAPATSTRTWRQTAGVK